MFKQVVYKILRIAYKLVGKQARKLGGIPFLYKGFHLLARYALTDANGLCLCEMHGHKMHITDEDIGYFMRGEYESEITEVFTKLVHEGDVVVDLGAHIGYYSLLAARMVGKDGKVFAFEPEPENYALLVKNVEINGYTNVITVQKAVCDKTGTAKLFLRGSGAHSLVDGQPSRFRRGSMAVQTVSLDEFFRNKIIPIRLIKMDIEGAEMLALLGMRETIERNSQLAIISECVPTFLKNSGFSAEEFLSKLVEYGFKVAVIGKAKDKAEAAIPIEILRKQRAGLGVNLICCKTSELENLGPFKYQKANAEEIIE